MVAMNDAPEPDKPTQIELDSQLSELKRTWAWIESIADGLQLEENMRYAIHLCIEEAVANTVVHGYLNEPGNPIHLRVEVKQGELRFCIEDRAAPFVPPPERGNDGLGRRASLVDLVPGGNGIRLMRQFAGSLIYEPLPSGNRLTIIFFWAPSNAA